VTDRTVFSMQIKVEHDIVLSRQRARQIAAALDFETSDQTGFATAVSEIARNTYQYGKGGRVEFSILGESPRQLLSVVFRDEGQGIPHLQEIMDGTYESPSGMGLGILGARRLSDEFELTSSENGTIVRIGKYLPPHKQGIGVPEILKLVDALATQAPQTPFEEIQRQNQDLLRALNELQARQEELARVNRELEDTNRGVVALYAELDERAGYLQRASELKTRFLSNMTHEFRTPLNSIISLCRLLLEHVDGDLTAEQEKQVKYIQKSAESLSELVNDLLDLAKVEAGKISVHPEAVDIQNLFSTLRGMLRPLVATNESVQLIFEEHRTDLPTLYTDSSKLSQILRNFISNALKYTEKGEIRVRAEPKANNVVVFAVSDTGIGIAKEHHERIFEEFMQLDSKLQKRTKGTGLGLSLSRRLATLLGGSIYLESTPGVGSTFFLELPAQHLGAVQEVAIPEPAQARPKVLIIDDDEIARYVLRTELTHEYILLEASNGSDGLTLARQHRPDAIILDLMMPGMPGAEVLRNLGEDPKTANIPVIIITSKSLSETELTFLKRTTVAIIKKDGNAREALLASLRAAIGSDIDARLKEASHG